MKRRAPVVFGLVALFLPGCGGDDSAEMALRVRRETAGKKLKITEPAAGATVEGNVVDLKVEGAGVRIRSAKKAKGDASGKTAHYHVFVDREPVAFGRTIPQERTILHEAKSPIRITGLTAGPHRFSVVLGDGNHRRIGRTVATVQVNVAGPSVRADALPKSPANQPVVLDMRVEGVGLVPPDGNTSGGTGHFDVFLDRDPTAADKPVPVERGIVHTAEQTIAIHDLPSGEHVIWVVLVDGAHRRFDPLVADKVVVQVG